jgi:hypothetical protein
MGREDRLKVWLQNLGKTDSGAIGDTVKGRFRRLKAMETNISVRTLS